MEERRPEEKDVVICARGEQFGGGGAEKGHALCEFLSCMGRVGLVYLFA